MQLDGDKTSWGVQYQASSLNLNGPWPLRVQHLGLEAFNSTTLLCVEVLSNGSPDHGIYQLVALHLLQFFR